MVEFVVNMLIYNKIELDLVGLYFFLKGLVSHSLFVVILKFGTPILAVGFKMLPQTPQ